MGKDEEKCGFCYRRDIVCMCNECEAYFCQECLQIHKNIPEFEGHNILKLCPRHPPHCLVYVCAGCFVFLCDKCLDLDEHLDHEDKVLALKPGLLTLQCKVKECQEQCEKNCSKLESAKYKKLKCIERNKKKRKGLVKQKEKLLERLQKISREIKRLNKQTDQLHLKVRRVEQTKNCYAEQTKKLVEIKQELLNENIDHYARLMRVVEDSMKECETNLCRISQRKIVHNEETDDQISATTEQKAESSETDYNANLRSSNRSAKRMKIDIQLNNLIQPLNISECQKTHKDVTATNRETSTQTTETKNESVTPNAKVAEKKSDNISSSDFKEEPDTSTVMNYGEIYSNLSDSDSDFEPTRSKNQHLFEIKTEVSENNSQVDIYSGSLKEPVGLACGQADIFAADLNKTEILQINWATQNISSVNLGEPVLSLDTYDEFLFVLHPETISKRKQGKPKEIMNRYVPKISNMSAINVVNEDLILVTNTKSCIYEYHVKTTKSQKAMKFDDEMLYLCIDPDKQNYYVTLCTQHKVLVYNFQWEIVTSLGGYHSDAAHLQLPRDVAVTPVGVTVADWNSRRVSLFTFEGNFVKHILDRSHNIKQPWRLAYKDDRLWVLDLTIGYTPSIRCYKLSALLN